MHQQILYVKVSPMAAPNYEHTEKKPLPNHEKEKNFQPNYTYNPLLMNALRHQFFKYTERKKAPDKIADSEASEASATSARQDHMINALGTLASAIYRDERHQKDNYSESYNKNQIRVFVFEHTEDFLLKPTIRTSSESGEFLTFPFTVEPKDETNQTPIFENDLFKTDEKTWLVGYDIETQAFNDEHFDLEINRTVRTPPQCVSHQWYFNFAGIRFGIILLTEKRLTQKQFVNFIDSTVPKVETFTDYLNMKLIRVYSHFSVYESGWLEVSKRENTQEFTFKNKPPRSIQVIMERNDEWYGYSPLRTISFSRDPKSARRGKGKPKDFTIQLLFGDSMKLQSGSLKALGKLVGINKKPLDKDDITKMQQFLVTHPFKFCDYAIYDSIITAEAHIYIYRKQLSLVKVEKEQMRMPGYSVGYFRKLYETNCPEEMLVNKPGMVNKMAWKKYLGYQNGKMTLTCKAFIRFYYGGRNDVVSVGPRKDAYYLDLHSAYLTSVVMLKDYNFSVAEVFVGAKAEAEVERLLKEDNKPGGCGPFQVIGVECSFAFKDTMIYPEIGERPVKPIFPVRIDEAAEMPKARVSYDTDGLMYPKNGTSCVTWPEFWVAKNLGLLEDCIVHKVTTFEKLDTNWLSTDVLKLLIERKKVGDEDSDTYNENDKAFYKNFLNFFYGKTAQGVQESASAIKSHDFEKRISTSAMTCFPLASYITGFCRSVVGELLQLNDCFGITTDGFMTPSPRSELITGELCNRVQQTLQAGKFHKQFIGSDYEADKSLFIKTRGYMFIHTTKPDKKTGEPPTTIKQKIKKIAAMSAQVDNDCDDPATDFLTQLEDGYADKTYFMKLTRVRDLQNPNNNGKSGKGRIPDKNVVPEKRTAIETAITSTYDMKHIPKHPITTDTFDWSDKSYKFVSFETEPLETATDFHVLRALGNRDNYRDIEKYSDAGLPDCVPKFSHDELDQMRDYWGSSGIILGDLAPPVPDSKKTEKPVAMTTLKPPKTKTMFGYKKDAARLIDLLLEMRTIPKYMEEADYVRMMEEFELYRTGKG
jgi:hypothetical protein